MKDLKVSLKNLIMAPSDWSRATSNQNQLNKFNQY